jgi:FkbM family methyltransferase
MIVIDIGACVGEYTDFCLNEYDVEKIYLFEPLSINYNSLVAKYKDNTKVVLYHAAVSNFDGKAPFYKKGYRQLTGEVIYEMKGNAGSSLRRDKTNVSKGVFDEVTVVKLSTFIVQNQITHIDILKIDVEGSEYDIIEDVLDSKLDGIIDKICYEDHARKVPSIKGKKFEVVNRIRDMGILGKFYLQSGLLKYVPAIKYWSKPT